jgi:hypothetical protein
MVRPWLAGHGSYATYSMSDVNSDIGSLNAQLEGSGLEMDEIHGALGFGLAFGLELPNRFSVGIGYDRLPASTDVGDASGSIEYEFPANAFRAFGVYSFSGPGAMSAQLGGSLGVVQEAGTIGVTVTDVGSYRGNIHGTGGLLELFVGGDWWTAPQFALTGSAGYRYAKIGELTLGGETIYLPNGEKESVDYSGVVVRLGIKYALTP